MKKINKITFFLLLLLGGVFVSCEDSFNLNLQDDPNEITEAQMERIMNQIYIDFGVFSYRSGVIGSRLTRIEHMRGRQYANVFDPSDWYSRTTWSRMYTNLYSDMLLAEAQTVDENGELVEFATSGAINVMKAYMFMTAVDIWGEVPFSEAGQSVEFPFPNADDDEAVYNAVIDMLNNAIASLENGGAVSNDVYYGGDTTKWIKLANTLKMNIYLNTRLVDGNAASKFNAIVATGDYISSTSDDFEFQWGTNLLEPDTRHEAYGDDYTASGAGNYRSNWLMNEMVQNNDPRLRYYFYRQVDCTPGAGCPPEPISLPYSVYSKPDHYPAYMIFVSVENGYWGKDHGWAEGIPPDSFKRTAVGVYPAGGMFDWDDFNIVGEGKGGGGAGVTPIMLASWVDLMKAEMAMTTNPASGSAFIQSSLEKSIAKVMSFGSLDPEADLSFAPSSTDVDNYISGIISDFDVADTEGLWSKWDILATQQFIGHYGNGMQSYNFYRRTGYPHSLQYNLEPLPGPFVRSLKYPANEANANTNIIQKPDVEVKVFWDTNPGHPSFPEAN